MHNLKLYAYHIEAVSYAMNVLISHENICNYTG